MIRTWIANVEPLLEKEKYLQCYHSVSLERRQKADACRQPLKRAQSVGAGLLWELMQKEYGLPEDGLYNLSHSGQYVMCSVADRDGSATQVGCDMEAVREGRFGVAKRFFCPSEHAWLMAQPIHKRDEAFFRYWVLKESFLKVTRQGMKLGLQTFEIAFDEKGRPYLCRQPEAFATPYFFWEYQVEGVPYKMAVCADEDAFDTEIHVIEL